jgi:hypothetical protein
MSHPAKKKVPRKGAWEDIHTMQDPDSGIGIVISERIRGKPMFTFQIVHFDDLGLRQHIPYPCPGAKHPVEWIIKSLTESAREWLDDYRKKKA